MPFGVSQVGLGASRYAGLCYDYSQYQNQIQAFVGYNCNILKVIEKPNE